jgi:V/A-type H+-transporting ATPase subunit C
MMQAREDFANMRLAIRRLVTEKPLGLDYSNEGGVPAEEFEEILQQENYERLPEYLQDAVEAAVLGYYENKDIRRIDYGIDKMQYQWRIHQAEELGSVFCVSYGRILVDLYNLRTMLRLKIAEREEKEFFFDGGFVDIDKFVQGLAAPYESVSGLFFATPYYEAMEESIRYLRSDQSFLKLEQQCEDYVMGFLRSTKEIAAGPQPVIAYFLMKEAEIRAVRMVLTGKKNALTPKLILDRLGNWHV